MTGAAGRSRECARIGLLLLLCAACAGEDAPETRRSARGMAGGTVGAAADTAAGTVVDTPALERPAAASDSGWSAGTVSVDRSTRAPALLREIRVAAHEDFDRIVLDFGGDALPGYRVEYVDRPVRACGSGEVVELPGDAWLSIELSPAHAHDEQGRATVTNRDLEVSQPAILRVRSTCDFEAIVTWVAAVRSPQVFRVLELDAPGRIVVDVRH